MRLMLATLCLNEMEWLPKLYEQHKDWPGLIRWVFVEAADVTYAQANPELVTERGLSTDGTSEFLQELTKRDDRVEYIPFGFSRHPNASLGKATARNEYLKMADVIKPDWFMLADADEFVMRREQPLMNEVLEGCNTTFNACCLGMRTIWRPPSVLHESLFKYEAVGGIWSLPHCRAWRCLPGIRYVKSHNWPELPNGYVLNQTMRHYYKEPDYRADPLVHIHLGWAAAARYRIAKTNYYAARGEGNDPRTKEYMECRRIFATWKPGDEMPYMKFSRAEVVDYNGPVPEVFQ